MRDETAERSHPLRKGFSTGACATAVSLAAATLVLGKSLGDSIEITLPKGQKVNFSLEYSDFDGEWAGAGTIKDAGDDPDVTHGALVQARVRKKEPPGVLFRAGPGVGTVTRAGLSLAVGEPAINPVPRSMMVQHLELVSREAGWSGGWEVEISVDGGEALAKKTMNARLGILGGLSILGTTGIVRPFSCSAYIASIHQSIDVAAANGIRHIAACTGNSSEKGVEALYQLPEMALIEMGDFVGAVVKYLKKRPIDRLTIAGGIGKLGKLAAGHLDLHSRSSKVDFEFLSGLGAVEGADEKLQKSIRQANTTQEVLDILRPTGISLESTICSKALAVVRNYLPEKTDVEILAFDREGQLLGRS